MINDVSASLATIESFLTRLQRPTAKLLRPGIENETLTSHLRDRGLYCHQELRDLYKWRDGTDAPSGTLLDDMHLIPGFYFLSLSDAISSYDSFITSARWNPSWLPIMANGGGDFYAVNCSESGDFRGSVFHFRIEQNEHPLEFRSVSDMFKTFAQAYVERIYYIDDHGYLEMNDASFASLAASLNPSVEWWKE